MTPYARHGRTLDDWLRDEGRLPLGELGPVVEGTLRALQLLHARKVVHRGVRPATILIGPSVREIDLLDGPPAPAPSLAASVDGGRRVTFETTVGNFAYMAPEQVRGARCIDPQADVYSLGAVAFRALTGRLPFEGPNALTLIALKLDRDAPRLSDVTDRAWPAPLESFVARSLAREPGERFSSASEAMVAWRRLFN